MEQFEYSRDFEEQITRLHRGKEDWPRYRAYLRAHLGGPHSRVVQYTKYLCPEIEYHCGKLQGKRVLDFGCGTGATTAALAHYCEQVTAFDIDEESIEICKQRIEEHGFENRVRFFCADDVDQVKDILGTFDIILMNGVVEHIPLSRSGLRRRIIRSLFDLLETPGYLFITDTPNRLWPRDSHSTGLWWIPWTKPGSAWAYRRAVRKGRHSDAPTISQGPLGLEEVGAWGATYWEIEGYLRGEKFVCLNMVSGHDRHFAHAFPGTWKRTVFEAVMYLLAVKLLRVPITALYKTITNLVMKKRR